MITDHLKNVCKIGQKEKTCRYLFAGENGFECGKLNPALKEMQDSRVYMMMLVTEGDNCDGVSDNAILNDMDYINKKLNEDK